jgi:hypothetical protein
VTRNAKLILASFGLGVAILACNLTASNLTSQAGQTLSNVAFAQALSEQAQANQQLAKAVQSVTHTMNLLLIIVLLLAFLGAGLYIWKTQPTASAPAPLPAPEPPLRVVYLPRPQLPETEGGDEWQAIQTADLLHTLTRGEEWQ